MKPNRRDSALPGIHASTPSSRPDRGDSNTVEDSTNPPNIDVSPQPTEAGNANRTVGHLADLITAFEADFSEQNEYRARRRRSKYLRALQQKIGWERTTDLPPCVFDVIRTTLSDRPSYIIRITQLSVEEFVCWASPRYAFGADILTGRLTSTRYAKHHIWTDVEVAMIMNALNAPMRTAAIPANATPLQRQIAQKIVTCDFKKRQALLPVIDIQLRWALRSKEVVCLCVRDWNSAECVLTIRRSATNAGRPRKIAMDRASADLLDAQANGRQPGDPLFRSYQKRRWIRSIMCRQFTELLGRLGLRGSLSSCQHVAVRALMERYANDLQHVLRITGYVPSATVFAHLQRIPGQTQPIVHNYEALYASFMQPYHEALIADRTAAMSATPDVAPARPARSADRDTTVERFLAQWQEAPSRGSPWRGP